MAEGRSHEIWVVAVQTFGAIVVAAITGFVTYINTSHPLKEQIEQLKETKALLNSEKPVPGNDLKVAQDEIALLRKSLDAANARLTEQGQLRTDLEKANASLDRIFISATITPQKDDFTEEKCIKGAIDARQKLGTKTLADNPRYQYFKIKRNTVMIVCTTLANELKILIAGTDSTKELIELRDQINKIVVPPKVE